MNGNLKSKKKANLHLHLTGSLTASDLRYLADLTKTDLSEYEPLENHFQFADPAIWSAAKEVTSNPHGLKESIVRVLKKEAADNVMYVELTINTAGMVRRGMLPKEFADAVTEALEDMGSLGVIGKIKCGVNRKDGPESVSVVKSTYLALAEKYRVGIDLNGDERTFPTGPFVEEFRELAAEGMPTIIHAGEYPDLINSLQDALQTRPTRLAHAVAAEQDYATIQEILAQGVVVEVAPTSNIRTQAVSTVNSHPLIKFIEYGIPVVLGNDDPAFFGVSMTNEFNALIAAGVSEEDLLTINKRGIRMFESLT